MSTRVFQVNVGTPFTFRPSDLPYSFCAQPSGGGTVLIDYSIDNGFTYVPSTPGAIATPYSFSNGTASQGLGTPAGVPFYPPGMIVRCTASTAAAQFHASDLSLPLTFGADKTSLVHNPVAYTMPNTTNEQVLWSMRFPYSYLPLNFGLEVEYWLTLTNNANVKTLKAYFGPVSYVAATGLEGGTNILSQAVTSFSNYVGRTGVIGRNDGQTVLGQNIGSAGGYGGNTTASVSIANTNYNTAPGAGAVEQVLMLTGTKATGTDTFTLDRVRVAIEV